MIKVADRIEEDVEKTRERNERGVKLKKENYKKEKKRKD